MTLAFPEYPCNSSSHTCQAEVKESKFKKHYLRILISRVAFPQGSCLGRLLNIIYAAKFFKIIEHHLTDAHCYADDRQFRGGGAVQKVGGGGGGGRRLGVGMNGGGR